MKSLKIKIKNKEYYISEKLYNINYNKIPLFEDKELKHFVIKNNKKLYISTNKLNEMAGAGYAVWGGTRGGYGNPANGFGQPQSSGSGPNIMYTYDVKPLNHTLEGPATPQGNNQYIHIGSEVEGTQFQPNNKEKIKGKIVDIKKDEEGDILSYIIINDNGIKMDLDPTSVTLISYNKTDNMFMRRDIIGEEFYPRLNNELNEKNSKRKS